MKGGRYREVSLYQILISDSWIDISNSLANDFLSWIDIYMYFWAMILHVNHSLRAPVNVGGHVGFCDITPGYQIIDPIQCLE